MLYKIDNAGSVVNEASLEKIKPFFRVILSEILDKYEMKIGKNLLSFYLRGSVSVGRSKVGISDVDTVAITREKMSDQELLWIAEFAEKLERQYPEAGLIDLTIISREELFESKKFKNLGVYLKTQSICLKGEDVVRDIPAIKPGKDLADMMYGNIEDEINRLKSIFSGELNNQTYLFRSKPINFWCVWMSRTFLRASLGLIMKRRPVYSQDLETCAEVFINEFPEYKNETKQLLKWNRYPSNDASVLSYFLNNYSKKFLKLWNNN